jgi:arsenical pump membrane protein
MRASAFRRPDAFEIAALGLLALGASFVATGLLPAPDAHATLRRLAPLLAFLATVVILARLVADAELFEVVAVRLTRLAGGDVLRLLVLCAAFAALTTMFLNLDTTAVLLTPVMLATAARIGIAAVPFAMTTVWLANTASLLLPVSNLTNLLAADRVGLSPAAFAARMAPAQLVAIAATMLCLWALHWRRALRDGDRYEPVAAHEPGDPLLLGLAAGTCVVFVAGLVAGVAPALASSACAALLALAFAIRRPAVLRAHLIPWQLLVFVVGLFLVVQTITEHGLGTIVHALAGDDGGAIGVLRGAGAGALASNLVNNLPAYVAGEAVVPVANHDQLLGLLVGTDVGPIVAPWGSLATLLWHQQCRAAGVRVPWRSFAATGAVAVAVTLAATLAAFVLLG